MSARIDRPPAFRTGDRNRLVAAACERPVLLLALWTCLLLAVHAPQQSFMPHDEGFYAQQARMIVESGDWITQHWWGVIQYDRAMGLQWLIAASYWLFGVSEFTARLPVMLAGAGTVVLTYAIGTRFASPATALLGAAILTATPIFMQAAKLGTQDVPLVFFEVLGIWALLRAEEEGARRRLWGALAGAALGLAFFVKGFMAVPAAAAMLPYLILEHRRHRHLANPGLYAGFALSLLPTIVWFALSFHMYGWEPLENYFGKLLLLARQDYHRGGPLYYLWNVPANAFPWPFLALAGAAMAWKSDRFARKWLFLGFPAVLFAELTLFTTRTWYYALQLLPFVALLAAVALAALGRTYAAGPERLHWALSRCLAVFGVLLVAAAVLLVVRPDLVSGPPVRALALIGIFGGLGFFLPLAVLHADRRAGRRSARAWMLGWLAGPWLAIACLYATGLWGDYSPQFKQELRSGETGEALSAGPVHFLFGPRSQDATAPEAVLLLLYTPDPGDRFSEASELPSGANVWIHDDEIGSLGRPYRTIGRAGSWQLLNVEDERPAGQDGREEDGGGQAMPRAAL